MASLFKLTKNLFKSMLMNIFPLIFCESLESFESVLLILPKLCTKNIIILIFIYIYYSLILADGLFYKFINTRYLFLPMSSLGTFLNPVHIIWASSFIEATIMRTHCLYKVITSGRSSLIWYDIAMRIKKDDHPIYFKISWLLFLGIFLSSFMIFSSQHVLKLTEFSTSLDYFESSQVE